jgi:hypothetical protein
MFPATNLMPLEPEVFYLNVEVVCAQMDMFCISHGYVRIHMYCTLSMKVNLA